MKFEKNLVLLRRRKGLSQEDLALAIGVSRQTIYTWEGGLNYPNILMLKKIAKVLEVSTDELLNGYDVSRLPETLELLEVTFVSEYDDKIYYREVPNWFISLEVGNEVCWAIYDGIKKDYSYHLTVLNEVYVHKEKGFEVLIEEYDERLNKTDAYSLIVRKKNERLSFIGRIFYENGVKNILTHRDSEFMKMWGIGPDNIGQSMRYSDVQVYELKYDTVKHKVFRVTYFDSDEDKESYFEVFLNKDFESLYWRRYVLNHKSENTIILEGKSYGMREHCITDRLI